MREGEKCEGGRTRVEARKI